MKGTFSQIRLERRQLIKEEKAFQEKYPPVSLRSTSDMVRVREFGRYGFGRAFFHKSPRK